MTGHTAFGQLVRYGVVGLVSNFILYAAYLALTWAGMDPKIAMTSVYAIGVLQTFFLNRRWSFRDVGAHGSAFVRYCFSYALGYAINLVALYFFVDYCGYSHQIVQAVMVVVIAFMMFVLHKYWVFRSPWSSESIQGESL